MMYVLKINTNSGVFYFKKEEYFSVLEIIDKFERKKGKKVLMSSGLILEDHNCLFKFLLEDEGFEEIQMNLRAISVRKE